MSWRASSLAANKAKQPQELKHADYDLNKDQPDDDQLEPHRVCVVDMLTQHIKHLLQHLRGMEDESTWAQQHGWIRARHNAALSHGQSCHHNLAPHHEPRVEHLHTRIQLQIVTCTLIQHLQLIGC